MPNLKSHHPNITAHNLIFVDVNDDLKERPMFTPQKNTTEEQTKSQNLLAAIRWFHDLFSILFSSFHFTTKCFFVVVQLSL